MLVAICGTIVALLLGEATARWIVPISDVRLLPFPYNLERIERIADGDVYLGFDVDLGWTPTPDRVRRADGAVYRINRQGLRADRDYADAPPGGIQRLAAFGDSFTHCSEVTQDACWTVRLEVGWADTEVLNFGVPGYGPDQAWLRYRRDGRSYQACGVLIGYFVGDIERVVNRFRPFIHPDDSVVLSKPRFVLDGAGLRLLPNPISDPLDLVDPAWVEATLGPDDAWYFPGTFVRQPLDGLALARLARTAAYQRGRASLVRTEEYSPMYAPGHEALEITLRVLHEFAADVRADGASPVLVVFPGMLDLQAAQRGLRAHGPLVDEARGAGIPTIDLTDRLARAVADEGLRAIFHDTHYSRRGNAIVAEELAALVPDMVAPTCAPERAG